MNNQDIRIRAMEKNIRLWQIAERLNLNDGNFSRLLRHRLPDEKREEIFRIIDEIAEEVGK